MRDLASRNSDRAWNPAEESDASGFLRRQTALEPVLDKLLSGVSFTMQGAIDPLAFGKLDPMFAGRLVLTPDVRLRGGKIRYTLDESEPTAASPVATGPVALTDSTVVKARWFDDLAGRAGGQSPLFSFAREYRRLAAVQHDALGAKVTLTPGLTTSIQRS